MAVRNCDADPTRTDPVIHPKLPVADALPICPMRIYAEPWIQDALTLWSRVKRWQALPQALRDEAEADLQALETIDTVMATPQPSPRAEV